MSSLVWLIDTFEKGEEEVVAEVQIPQLPTEDLARRLGATESPPDGLYPVTEEAASLIADATGISLDLDRFDYQISLRRT
ncbi:MAG: hypothetical protein M3198_04455 [Actinomycetota bacterium]|nr:hypothetical protein [Actinomycetota bacterium]